MNEKYNLEQVAWCNKYETITFFKPIMDEFEAGNETFQQAALRNVQWFEAWSAYALQKCDLNYMSLKDKP